MKRIISLLTIAFLVFSQASFVQANNTTELLWLSCQPTTKKFTKRAWSYSLAQRKWSDWNIYTPFKFWDSEIYSWKNYLQINDNLSEKYERLDVLLLDPKWKYIYFKVITDLGKEKVFQYISETNEFKSSKEYEVIYDLIPWNNFEDFAFKAQDNEWFWKIVKTWFIESEQFWEITKENFPLNFYTWPFTFLDKDWNYYLTYKWKISTPMNDFYKNRFMFFDETGNNFAIYGKDSKDKKAIYINGVLDEYVDFNESGEYLHFLAGEKDYIYFWPSDKSFRKNIEDNTSNKFFSEKYIKVFKDLWDNTWYFHYGWEHLICEFPEIIEEKQEVIIEPIQENKNSLKIDKASSFKKTILSRRALNKDVKTIKYVKQIDSIAEKMDDTWKLETILSKLYKIETKLEWKSDEKSIKLINIVDYLIGKMELRILELTNTQESIKTEIKDLWNNFSLNQTIDETKINYKSNTIYTWSHTIKEVPFVWDEWCQAILNKFQNSDQAENNWKQKAWESLSTNEQKLCMKESYSKNINIENLSANFFNIVSSLYESSNKMLFNTEAQKLYQDVDLGFIEKIVETENWLIIQSASGYACDWKITLLNNLEEKLLFVNNCDVDEKYKPDNYRNLQDFTLVDNNTIKLIYIWKDWEAEKTIRID